MKRIKAFEMMYNQHGECHDWHPVNILSYDHDKYVLVEDENGVWEEIKRGVVVKQKGSEIYFSHKQLLKLPKTLHSAEWDMVLPDIQPTNREVAKLLKQCYKKKISYEVNGIKTKNILQAVKVARKFDSAVIVRKVQSGSSWSAYHVVVKENGIVTEVDSQGISYKRMAKLFKDQW